MDTITHAIVGAVVARASASDKNTPDTNASDTSRTDTLPIKQRVAIGSMAAAFPDIDFITALIHPLAYIAEWHRSFTHSFVMLPIWALAVGFLLAWLFRKTQYRKEIILLCALSVFSHIITDLITGWGTQLFSPISNHAFSWGLTFIIDPWFTGIILIALLVSLSKDSRTIARVGLVMLSAYVGLQGVLKYQADALGQDYIVQQGLHAASVYTMPQPFSPFNWKVVVTHDTQYHMAHVNLIADDSLPLPDDSDSILLRLVRHYRPKEQLDWEIYQRAGHNPASLAAWNRPEFELYREFAVLPFLYDLNNNHNEQCNWFGDLRFLLPQITLPFRYGMCHETQPDRWLLYRLNGGGTGGRELIPPY